MVTILLVEDSRFLRVATERSLIKAGYSVLCSGDGEEGLRLAAEKLPNLILLDMLLPKLGGQEVLHRLKSNALTADIPVIVLSSLPQTNENRLREEGALAYFEKTQLLVGSTTDLLIQAIERILRQRQKDVPHFAAPATE